jgi:hypothetical protein
MSGLLRGAMGMFIAGSLLAACHDATTTVDRPGDFVVSLRTPFADDGAVLVGLYGLPPGAVDVTAEDRSSVVYSVRIADTLRIAVFGAITSGPLVRVGPLDGSAVLLIATRVEDAASRANELREPLSGYGVELRRR